MADQVVTEIEEVRNVIRWMDKEVKKYDARDSEYSKGAAAALDRAAAWLRKAIGDE